MNPRARRRAAAHSSHRESMYQLQVIRGQLSPRARDRRAPDREDAEVAPICARWKPTAGGASFPHRVVEGPSGQVRSPLPDPMFVVLVLLRDAAASWPRSGPADPDLGQLAAAFLERDRGRRTSDRAGRNGPDRLVPRRRGAARRRRRRRFHRAHMGATSRPRGQACRRSRARRDVAGHG